MNESEIHTSITLRKISSCKNEIVSLDALVKCLQYVYNEMFLYHCFLASLGYPCSTPLKQEVPYIKNKVDISGAVGGDSSDGLLLSETVVGEILDHVCWELKQEHALSENKILDEKRRTILINVRLMITKSHLNEVGLGNLIVFCNNFLSFL